MLRWSLLAGAYACMAGIALLVAGLAQNRAAWVYPEPWFRLPALQSHGYSLALGVGLGLLVVFVTRRLVERFLWAQELARALRPFASGLSGAGILVVALLSSVGEELLFRGLLQPWLGVLGQALLFGFLHQLRGPGRWPWVAWASIVGFLFGAVFSLTGSLLGPICAHALINGLNLIYLQNHNPEYPRRGLGGLLGQRSRA